MTYGKKLTSSVKMDSVWGPVLYCNLLAAGPMFLLGYTAGDFDDIGEKLLEMPANGIMVLLFAIIGLRILSSMRMSNGSTMNMVLAAGALFVYMLMNFQKSFDAYKNREAFILCALPVAMYAYLSIADNVHGVVKKSRRKRRRVATAIAINEVRKSERLRSGGMLDGKSAPASSR